jgi:hypothetical protein
MIELLIGAAALAGGFLYTRGFVKQRLRFVEKAQKPSAPVIAGAVATAVILPVAALPLIAVSTAVAFGVGVGTGWASGQRANPES